MTEKKPKTPLIPTLGELLESLRNSIPVNGKRLTIDEVCHIAPMSQHTYMALKRAAI